MIYSIKNAVPLSLLTYGLLLATPLPVLASATDGHAAAEALGAKGDAEGMEQAYDDLLAQSPADLKALTGRAIARSWQGEHEQAQADFLTVLKAEPNDIAALTGLGYSYAWNKQYDKARATFERALIVAPDSLGAQKGLGYSFLWSGDSARALEVFQKAEAAFPLDAELKVAVARCLLALNQPELAQEKAQAALTLDATRGDAKALLSDPAGAPKYPFEISIWAGTTSNADSGLRLVEVAYSPDHDWRLAVRYDNSLSLDNPALARAGTNAEAYIANITHRIDDEWLVSAEAGFRNLPESDRQEIYKLEVVYDDALKLGAQLSPHSDGFDDELYYAAVAINVDAQWKLEPVVYLSTSGAGGDEEVRGVLNLEHRSEAGWRVGVGAGVGHITSDFAANEGEVFTASARGSVPVSDEFELHATLVYEDAPQNNYTTALVGVTYRLGED